MLKKYPEIRIGDGWLLRQNASAHLHELWAKKDDKLADDEDMKKIVTSYRKTWQPVEKKIIKAMCNLYDLEYRQNI